MKIFRPILFLFSFFISIFLSVQAVSAFSIPNYDGFVNDFANVLSDDFEMQLEDRLRVVSEGTSGAELAVVIISSLEDETVEDVSQQFFDDWGIGKKGVDNGVLFLLAIEDRKLRIHTGYGAEAVIPDGLAGRIIRNDVVPYLKNSDYQGAVQIGVDQILKHLDDPKEFQVGSQITDVRGSDEAEGLFAFITSMICMFGGVAVLVYLVSFLSRTKSWWLGGVIGLILGIVVGGLVAAIAFGIFGLLLDLILSKNYKSLKKSGKSTGWKSSWGGFKSSSGSSYSSSSSSSFGGGSSGGGGASGGW